MKKLLLILIIAVMTTTTSFAQEINETKIDKFTGETLAVTTREVLARDNSMKNPHVITYCVGGKKDKVDNIDYSVVVFASAMRIFSVDEGNRIMFLLADGTIITGTSPGYQIADRSNSRSFIEGANNYSSCVEYEFDNFDWVSDNNPITTVRIETNKTNIEADVKPANHAKFARCFEIIKDAIK